MFSTREPSPSLTRSNSLQCTHTCPLSGLRSPARRHYCSRPRSVSDIVNTPIWSEYTPFPFIKQNWSLTKREDLSLGKHQGINTVTLAAVSPTAMLNPRVDRCGNLRARSAFCFPLRFQECDGGRRRSPIQLALEREHINMAKVIPDWTCQTGGDSTRFGDYCAHGLILA